MEALSSTGYRSQWALLYSSTNTYTFKVGASGSEKNLIEVDGANGTAVRLNVYNGATVVNRITYNNIGLSFNGATPIAKPAITGDRNSGAATASLITQLANLGLVTDTTTATFQPVGRLSGTLTNGTAVVVVLSTLGLTGVPTNIRVMPDSGSTVLIESSTDGSTYTTLVSATADYSTTWFPTAGATNITHLRFTRSAGTGVTSGYHVY